MSDEHEIESTATEARATFDLGDRLQNRALRSGRIRIFTDEITGEEHTAAEEALAEARASGQAAVDAVWPAEDFTGEDLEDVIRLTEERAAKQREAIEATTVVTEARKVVDDLRAKLDESALDFSLRAVPPFVAKSAKRKARQDFAGKDGVVPPSAIENFGDHYTAYILESVIVEAFDADGATTGPLPFAAAKGLQEYLPKEQFDRLNEKVVALQFKQAIATSVVDDEDF